MAFVLQSRIGRRLGAYVGFIMAFFGLGGLLVLLLQSARARDGYARQQLRTLAGAIESSYTAMDSRTQRHPAADIIASLGEREELASVDIFSFQGQIQVALDSRRKGVKIEDEILEQILSGPGGAGRRALVPVSAARVVVALRKRSSCLPCHEQSPDPIGGLHLLASQDYLSRDFTAAALQGGAATILVVLFITGVLVLLTDRMVLVPLIALSDVVSRAEEGDFFVRAAIRRHDEIGFLAASFNKLLAKITDLRAERIDSDREISAVKDELSLKAEIAQKSQALDRANSRLEEQLSQLGFLYELSRELAAQLRIEALLERFAHLVQERLRVPGCAILLFDARRPLLVVAAKGLSVPISPDRGLLLLEDSISGISARSKQAVYVPDLVQDGRNVLIAEGVHGGSLVCVPVIYQNRLIGLLHFTSPKLQAFDQAQRELFTAISHHAALAMTNAQLFDETLELSLTDELTGIANRRSLEQRLDLEWSNARRYQHALSLLMIDVDHFKHFNDHQGHQHGDEALRRIARVIERSVRKVDAPGRYGGEEFLICLPRTNKTEALGVAEKLRRSVEETNFAGGDLQPLGRVTISVGVATAPDDADSLGALIKAADEALYAAKGQGRNMVVTAKTASGPPRSASEEG